MKSISIRLIFIICLIAIVFSCFAFDGDNMKPSTMKNHYIIDDEGQVLPKVQPGGGLERFDNYNYPLAYVGKLKLPIADLRTIRFLIFAGEPAPAPDASGNFLTTDTQKQEFDYEFQYLIHLKQSAHLNFNILLGLGNLDNLNADNMNNFILLLKSILEKYKMAGVDIDWMSNVSAVQYSQTIHAISSALKGKYEISVTMAPITNCQAKGVAKIEAILNVMNYLRIKNYDASKYNSPDALFAITGNWHMCAGVPYKDVIVGIPIFATPTNGDSNIDYSTLTNSGADCKQNKFNNYIYNGIYLVKQKIKSSMLGGVGGYFNMNIENDVAYSNSCSLVAAEDRAFNNTLKCPSYPDVIKFFGDAPPKWQDGIIDGDDWTYGGIHRKLSDYNTWSRVDVMSDKSMGTTLVCYTSSDLLGPMLESHSIDGASCTYGGKPISKGASEFFAYQPNDQLFCK